METWESNFVLVGELIKVARRLRGTAAWFTNEFILLRDCIKKALEAEVGMERTLWNLLKRRAYWQALSGEAQMLKKNVRAAFLFSALPR